MTSDSHRRCTCTLLGIDPARMSVHSTSIFITNDKMKAIWVFCLFVCFSPLLTSAVKAVPVWFVHTLNNYCLLMPDTRLKSQDIKMNYPQPCPSGVHNQEKRLKKPLDNFKVSGEIKPWGSDNDPHQCVCLLDSAICPCMRRLLELLPTLGLNDLGDSLKSRALRGAFRVPGLHLMCFK